MNLDLTRRKVVLPNGEGERTLHSLSRAEFARLAGTDDLRLFLDRIEAGDFFIVKNYLTSREVETVRRQLFAFRDSLAPSWHPLHDNCPDYHRINDAYEGSRVKGRFRVYHFHRWNAHSDWFDRYLDIFELKCRLAGKKLVDYWDNEANQLVVPRLTANHYPRGGGFLSEHCDATNEFARVQSIIQLSTRGREFKQGGLYARPSAGAEPVYLDDQSEAGDLLLLSPGIEHGVAPVDPHSGPLNWESKEGRFMLIPILLPSDYVKDEALRSKMVSERKERELGGTA